MFDIGWSELLLIGGVALVVIGPKDLPRALRTLGQTTAKMKRMAADFQRQFNEAMREADMEDFRQGVSDVVDTARDLKNNFNPIDRLRNEIRDAIDDSGAPKSQPVTDASTAGDYFTHLPEQPALEPAGQVIAAEATPAKAATQGEARATEAGTETSGAPVGKKRAARPGTPETMGEGVAEPASRKPARARRKSPASAAKTGALPVDTHPVLPPEAPAAPKRTRARKAATTDAMTADAAPKKPAPRRKAPAAAGDVSAASLAPGVGAPPVTAPSAEAITPAHKPASDGTS